MRLIDKIKKMGSLLILSTCCLTSCNFLDVVPPEQAGLGDAVKKPESTLGFLYSCYAGIKGSSNPITYTGMEAASTETGNGVISTAISDNVICFCPNYQMPSMYRKYKKENGLPKPIS